MRKRNGLMVMLLMMAVMMLGSLPVGAANHQVTVTGVDRSVIDHKIPYDPLNPGANRMDDDITIHYTLSKAATKVRVYAMNCDKYGTRQWGEIADTNGQVGQNSFIMKAKGENKHGLSNRQAYWFKISANLNSGGYVSSTEVIGKQAQKARLVWVGPTDDDYEKKYRNCNGNPHAD